MVDSKGKRHGKLKPGGGRGCRARAFLLATRIRGASAMGLSAQAQNAMNTIDELVVTAEKRVQSLQDVPVAISAFSSHQRDLGGISTVQDLTNFPPAFVYQASSFPAYITGLGSLTTGYLSSSAVPDHHV